MKDSAQRSLRSRLTASYVAILLAGLIAFAALAVFAIDRNLRATLDARLATSAKASATFVDVSHGHIVIDADDREQILSIVGVDTDAVVLGPDGAVLLSTAARTPAPVLALSKAPAQYATIGQGDSVARVFALPVEQDARRIGTVVVWRSSDWIEETDRGAAIALTIGALLIAALALVAGDLVTRRALQDAFSRQRRFTADASHELRAPLAVIRAEADLALRKEREAGAYVGAIETIAAEADRMEALIGDLLSAARAESGNLAREPVDASIIARTVRERLASAAAAKGASLSVDAREDAVVLADRHALERALAAVAHNAVAHAPPRGHVSLAVHNVGSAVEMTVRDDGPGFTPEALHHATERFWHDRTERTQGGTGLGLAIAKSIVEACGGTIALSNANGGAEVRFRLPAAPR